MKRNRYAFSLGTIGRDMVYTLISKVNMDPQYRVPLAKLLAVIQFTLKGTPFVFQGDEMGLVNYNFNSMDEVTDVEEIKPCTFHK